MWAGAHAHPAHLVEDMPGGESDHPPKFQPDHMHGCAVHTKSVIFGSFLLVGEVGVAAHPADLVEDMPGGEANSPTKFQPCIVILGSFLLVGVDCGHALRPRPPRPPSERHARR